MSDFDWSGPGVVLRAYGSLAVHENIHGDVVVRQERDAFDDDDHFVVLPLQDAELIAQAIIDKAREIRAESKGDEQPEQRGERRRSPESREPAQPRLALATPPANDRQPINGACHA
jgi:hypothetical protein